jgi:type I restriction enzyme, S subunit
MTIGPWEIRPLSDVAEVRTGFAKNTSVTVTQPVSVHYLRVANVQDGFLDLSDVSRIDVSRSDLQRFEVLPGDVLMNEGGDLDKLGRGAIWNGAFDPCIHQNHVFVVRCSAAVRPAYLRMWSSGAVARRYFLVAGKQTTNLASISKTALSQLPVAVPPLHEQDAIAEALSDVDALLAGLDRLIAKKRNLKQAAMQQLLTGQTRLPGFGENWETCRLGHIAEMSSGGTPNSSVAGYYGGNIPWVSISDMTVAGKLISETERSLTSLGLANSAAQMFPAGTVLYAMYASLGECSIAAVPLCTSQAILGIRPKNVLNSDFLYYYLSALKPLVRRLGQQGTQANLSKAIVEDFPITLPNLSEQSAIVSVLSCMDQELDVLQIRRDKTNNLKQAMMQELLTGRIRLI